MSEKVGVYAVYDHKSKTYDIPFFAKNDFMAGRRFVMDCRSKEERSVIAKFRDDFEMRKLGTYSMETGKFIQEELFEIIIQGKEVQDE